MNIRASTLICVIMALTCGISNAIASENGLDSIMKSLNELDGKVGKIQAATEYLEKTAKLLNSKLSRTKTNVALVNQYCEVLLQDGVDHLNDIVAVKKAVVVTRFDLQRLTHSEIAISDEQDISKKLGIYGKFLAKIHKVLLAGERNTRREMKKRCDYADQKVVETIF